jgi:hypothetical protein
MSTKFEFEHKGHKVQIEVVKGHEPDSNEPDGKLGLYEILIDGDWWGSGYHVEGKENAITLAKQYIDKGLCSSDMEARTSFNEAFPEVADLHDKLSELREKVGTGAMSCEEANAILKEANRAIKEAAQKIRTIRPNDRKE